MPASHWHYPYSHCKFATLTLKTKNVFVHHWHHADSHCKIASVKAMMGRRITLVSRFTVVMMLTMSIPWTVFTVLVCPARVRHQWPSALSCICEMYAMSLLILLWMTALSSMLPFLISSAVHEPGGHLAQGVLHNSKGRGGVRRNLHTILLLAWHLTYQHLPVSADEVAYDSSSPGVRLAVVQGLTGLVGNALAQPLLKLVLPKLGALLHDSALKVRIALADLLLAVM